MQLDPLTINGNLCDTFEHMKHHVKLPKSEDDEIGRLWSMLILPQPEIPHIICGDKCGYVWILHWDWLNLLDIFEAHSD